MKKLGLTLVLLSAFLFTACGGVSTNPLETINNINKFNTKAAIFILKGTPKKVCEGPLFKASLSEALSGVITHERSNTATCSDYSRTNNRQGCYQENYPETTPGNLACVIGYDGVKENSNNENILNTLIIGTIIDLFILIAG